jgi:hypothetical protein
MAQSRSFSSGVGYVLGGSLLLSRELSGGGYFVKTGELISRRSKRFYQRCQFSLAQITFVGRAPNNFEIFKHHSYFSCT